jgi:anti-sigma factor RsiW
VSDPRAPIGDDDLHAYADGRLDPARRAEVEVWIAQSPEAAARVAFYRRLNVELHRRFDPVLAEPLSAKMQEPRSWTRSRIARAVAVAGLVVLGAAGGWTARGLMHFDDSTGHPPAPPLAAQAAVAHAVYAVEVRHPVEVAVEEEAHLVTWLSRRLGQTIKAPHLEASGWRLMGGRLLPAAEGGVACQFMYENAGGNRITLFVKASAEEQAETAFRFALERDGVSVFYWLDRKMGYALSGRLDREDLLRLARAVYEQLNG